MKVWKNRTSNTLTGPITTFKHRGDALLWQAQHTQVHFYHAHFVVSHWRKAQTYKPTELLCEMWLTAALSQPFLSHVIWDDGHTLSPSLFFAIFLLSTFLRLKAEHLTHLLSSSFRKQHSLKASINLQQFHMNKWLFYLLMNHDSDSTCSQWIKGGILKFSLLLKAVFCQERVMMMVACQELQLLLHSQ